MLVDGDWKPDETLETDETGAFVRQESAFRDRVRDDPSATHPAAPGRYHLYVSYACPWAHRTLITRSLLGLESIVSVDVVDPIRRDDGWEFSPEKSGCTPDTVNGTDYLRDVYTRADPTFTGRPTVPVLWDRERETIVNNESAEIMRMLDTAVASTAGVETTLYPEDLAAEIDGTIEHLYGPINDGVYRAGFAETQSAYEAAVDDLFAGLDRWDDVLADRRYLLGERLTEADVCLFTTLVRFDPVYHVHFKCSRRRIVDYPNLWNYCKELAQLPAIRRTIDLEHVRVHYYRSHADINPTGLVAVPYAADLRAPHDRGRLPGGPPTAARSG